MFLSFQSSIQNFQNIIMDDIVGNGNLWNFLYSKNISFDNISIINMKTIFTSIIVLSYSTMKMSNSKIEDFYPIFLYSSYSNLFVENSSFCNSFNQFKNKGLEIIAIYLENDNSFKINNNKFDSLANNNFGSVKSIFFDLI